MIRGESMGGRKERREEARKRIRMWGRESNGEVKKKQQPDNDSGSNSELNSLSSGGNDMKPVIYRRRGGGRDQMTNYTVLWSLKQCTLGSGAGHRLAEPGRKGSDHPAECIEQVSISDSAGGGQVCVRLDREFRFRFFFFLSLRVFKALDHKLVKLLFLWEHRAQFSVRMCVSLNGIFFFCLWEEK